MTRIGKSVGRWAARFLAPALALATAFSAAALARADAPDLLLILDASGSMWGQIGGEPKIVAARRVMTDLITGLPDQTNVGLLAYGHRRKGDCKDIETLVSLGPLDKASLVQKIEDLNPQGMTPITDSVKQALAIAGSRERRTTVILVSDGIESCGGDPCRVVGDAKARGVEFVMHVVGFDVVKENVVQLECAAQAGGGRYFPAANADQLGVALRKAAEPVPDGRLSIKTLANGELVDTGVRIFNAATGREVAFSRTYTATETNPRVIPLEDGVYDVQLQAIRLKGDIRRELKAIEIRGELVEKTMDFSPGTVHVRVTTNGHLSDAAVKIFEGRTGKYVAGGRTYNKARTNPIALSLTPGTYDIVVSAVDMKGADEERIEGVEVEGGGTLQREVGFASGTLRIGARRGGELVDAAVSVRRTGGGRQVAGGRTYTSAKTNPKAMEIPPGSYRVDVSAVKLKDKPHKTIEVRVTQGEVTEHLVEM